MLARFINYLLLPIHTAVFIPSDYGVVSALYAYVSLMIVLFTYGMETGFFRFATHQHDKQKVYATAQISLLITSVVFASLISFFASPIAAFIHFLNHPEFVICFAWILGLDAIASIPFARLRLENRPVKYGLIKLTNVLVNVGFSLWFLVIQPYLKTGVWFSKLESDSVMYVFISNLIASAVTLVVVVYTVRKVRMSKIKTNFLLDDIVTPPAPSSGLVFDFPIWKEMLIYSLPLLIVGLAGMVNETLDRVLLLNFLPFDSVKNLSLVGIYSASYKLSILMTLFVQAYRMAAEPFFFNESKKLDAKIMYARTMNYFAIACSFIFIFVMCFLDYFKYFLRDQNYFAGLQIVPILLLANLCLGVYYNLTIWYKLTDKTLVGSYISVMGAVITIGLNFYLIPKIGYLGSAWATLACYASMMIVSFLTGQKFYAVPYDVKKFILYVGAALLIGWALNPYFHQLFEYNQFLYIVMSVATLAFFVLLVFLIERKFKNPEWNTVP